MLRSTSDPIDRGSDQFGGITGQSLQLEAEENVEEPKHSSNTQEFQESIADEIIEDYNSDSSEEFNKAERIENLS
ncbi:hypothetical protein KQX54_005590 [Cotesia glomerata]|uniref:Uncharacterized protein n=1 Tax=Cotesia glomerata TaxID=32391 RepID=A0AAV7IL44_COTGL|nr:hypothetical protein KQX54_005590 [Cotesia glomerata]